MKDDLALMVSDAMGEKKSRFAIVIHTFFRALCEELVAGNRIKIRGFVFWDKEYKTETCGQNTWPGSQNTCEWTERIRLLFCYVGLWIYEYMNGNNVPSGIYFYQLHAGFFLRQNEWSFYSDLPFSRPIYEKKAPQSSFWGAFKMAGPTGFEPAISGLTGQCVKPGYTTAPLKAGKRQ